MKPNVFIPRNWIDEAGAEFATRTESDDIEYVHIDAYEAQAVRIAELESENTSLKNVAEANINAGVEMAGRIRELEDALTEIKTKAGDAWERANKGYDEAAAIGEIEELAGAALKPKEGKPAAPPKGEQSA